MLETELPYTCIQRIGFSVYISLYLFLPLTSTHRIIRAKIILLHNEGGHTRQRINVVEVTTQHRRKRHWCFVSTFRRTTCLATRLGELLYLCQHTFQCGHTGIEVMITEGDGIIP